MLENKKNFLLLLLGTAWFITVVVGFSRLYNHEFKAGPLQNLAEQWPAQTSIERRSFLWQLIMVAHPYCPCTKASIEELGKIMTRGQSKINAYVLFLKPRQFDEDWVKSDIYKRALMIPGVTTIIDEDALQAKLFGGTTSGQIFFYSPQGRLAFSGGITASRGHSGDNAGVSAILDLINNQPVETARTPFFGCPLQDDQRNTAGD